MRTYVGVDGCRAGWFYVALDEDGSADFNIAPDARCLWKKFSNSSMILIDIPIGLREGGDERPVDKIARRVLTGRASSVYPVPCRPALCADNYPEASRLNFEHTGRKLSKQSWAIAPKIRQVDKLLQAEPASRALFSETHPEVIFWALNGRHPMQHNKKTPEGNAERLALLLTHHPQAEALISAALAKFSPGQLARDDVVDALANAVTAWKSRGKLACIPNVPDLDSTGLPMEMAYFLPQ